jgi:hypothetical protein
MAEVMDRAARRAAMAEKPEFEVGIYLVPPELVVSYAG